MILYAVIFIIFDMENIFGIQVHPFFIRGLLRTLNSKSFLNGNDRTAALIHRNLTSLAQEAPVPQM